MGCRELAFLLRAEEEVWQDLQRKDQGPGRGMTGLWHTAAAVTWCAWDLKLRFASGKQKVGDQVSLVLVRQKEVAFPEFTKKDPVSSQPGRQARDCV